MRHKAKYIYDVRIHVNQMQERMNDCPWGKENGRGKRKQREMEERVSEG
jgi:hypothetical protein